MQPSPVVATVALGAPPWPTLDPFLFCVHHVDAYPAGDAGLGPAASLAGRALGQDFAGLDGWRMYHGRRVPGFPQHPHRGFETVTLLRRGLVDHADSLGATARFGPGDAQHLTAGDGIVHAEMFPLVHADAPNPLELFQIWLNLPAADKRCAPHFAMHWAETVPVHAVPDVNGRVTRVVTLYGPLAGRSTPIPPPHSWASRAEADVAIWTLELPPGGVFELPSARDAATHRVLYFFGSDRLRVADREVSVGTGVQLRGDAAVRLECTGAAPADLLLLQGRPIGEPVAQYGPFVMNTQAELQAAFRDYQRTGFGGWPWPDDDPVHARDAGRFARHADGRHETPPAPR